MYNKNNETKEIELNKFLADQYAVENLKFEPFPVTVKCGNVSLFQTSILKVFWRIVVVFVVGFFIQNFFTDYSRIRCFYVAKTQDKESTSRNFSVFGAHGKTCCIEDLRRSFRVSVIR